MKIIEKIKKHDNIIMLFAIGVIVCSIVFWVQTLVNDELWNFSNIYKMVNGYTIYKDTNVIITPLFFYIGKVLFEMIGANYIVYRIYQALIFIFMYFAIYLLFKALKVRKLNSALYVLVIMIAYREGMIATGAYNQLAIAFYIVGIIFLIKQKHKPLINNIIQGIIIFLIFLSKQNLAVYYIIANIICKVLINRKEVIKSVVQQLLTSFILLVIFLLTLYLSNNLYDFINYTILGIGEFASKNTVMPITNLIMVLIQILLLIAFFIISRIQKIPFEADIRKNIKILTIFSIMIIFFAYPIFNLFHIYLESELTIVLTLYILDCMIVETLLKNRKIDVLKKISILLITAYFALIFINNNTNYLKYMYKEEGPYYGAIFSEEIFKEMNEVVEYIKDENSKGYEVKIISNYANLYMNVLKKNNGAMDLPFSGNLGKNGVEGMINQIKNLENAKILITKEKDNQYQESDKIREYIQNSFEQIDEINRFFVYEKK